MSRRRRPAPPDDGNRWLATYGDMVTLLMAFFVMMFALSNIEQEKFDAFLSGLDMFGNPASAQVFDPVGEEGVPVEPEPPAPDLPAVSEDATLEALGRQVLDAVAAAGFPGTVEVRVDDRGLGIAIGTDHVLFDVGSAVVTPQGRRLIAAVAPPVAAVDNPVFVEGHADRTPLNRAGYTNWNLSTDRAVAVVNALVGDHGFAPKRMTASGFGEFRPRDPAGTPAAMARNRRVELIVARDPIPTAATHGRVAVPAVKE